MKNLLIKKYNENKEQDFYGYTEYSLPDKELRNSIIEYVKTIDLTSFELLNFNRGKWSIIQFREDGKVKCSNEDEEVKLFDKSMIDTFLKEKILDSIEKKFPISENFIKTFGKLYWVNEINNSESYKTIDLKILEINKTIDLFASNASNVRVFEKVTRIEYWNTKEYTNTTELGIKVESYGHMMSLYFNKDGNLMNRDYNEDLDDYTNTPYDPKKLLELFYNDILSLGDLEYSAKSNNYFIPGYCLTIDLLESSIIINKIPVRNDNQKSYGDKIIKKPKILKKITAQEFLSTIKTYFTDSMKEKLGITEDVLIENY